MVNKDISIKHIHNTDTYNQMVAVDTVIDQIVMFWALYYNRKNW